MFGPRRPRFDAGRHSLDPGFRRRRVDALRPDHGERSSAAYPLDRRGRVRDPIRAERRPPTGEVWMAANNSDRILRFSPSTKTFRSYPSPTRVTVLRDFSFTSDGRVCSVRIEPALVCDRGSPAIVHLHRAGGRSTRSPRAWTQGAAAPAWGRTLKSTCLHDGVAAA